MKTRRYVITGKVQGVYFRAWTRDAARNLGLNGWVKNLPDGSVEALAQGKEHLLDLFGKQLLEGSPLSRVDEVFMEDSSNRDTPQPFEFRH